MNDYESTYRDFRWEVPEHFNFGAAVDVFGAEPGRPAILYEDHNGNRARLCFADIREQSNRIANVLAGLGVKPGDAVMIALPRITLWQAAYVGALKAGAIVVPCGAALCGKDLVHRANHCGAVAIVAAIESADLVSDLRNRCPSLKHYFITGSPRSGWLGLRDSMAKASADFAPVRTRASDLAICLYTSGTAHEPKAVLHSHAHTWCHRYTGSYWLDLRAGELHWATADTGWAKAGYGVLFGPWMNGAAVFMYNGGLEPRKQLELLARYSIATLCAPPTEYRMLLKEDIGSRQLPALRHCTATGEALNPEVIGAWRDRFGLAIHDGYGQAETAILAANLPGMEIKAGSMGRPFPGHDVRVLAAEDREAGAGEVGEIAIRTNPERPPSLMLEYWKNPEENAAVFRGDYYFTGDLASRDSDGYLWFAGRADDLIISAGHRIGPFEVEGALLEHPAVTEAAAVASPDRERGTIVKAFVKLKPGVEPSFAMARELQEHVKRTAAPYKVPREIEFVDDLPKGAGGKIRRGELREAEKARARAG
ncbi:MAG TPA: AMP-binding protein [Candidatus Binataceae bacterium]|nr:AMP-binding protein [Candidatus Binataceae bacterium]